MVRQGGQFFLGKIVCNPGLDNQNTDGVIPVEERNADKGMELFFAGLREIAVGRMVLRFLEGQNLFVGCDGTGKDLRRFSG